MPPLTRQRTPQSLHSEWSRSSLGATISIHALAKPLMKVMYHSAVLNLIKGQQGIPLSAETMEIYESYLSWKYVAETTKTLILREIYRRALVEGEAHVVSDFVLSYDGLLESTNVAVRRWATWVLAWFAFHSSTREAVVAVQPCVRLSVALLKCVFEQFSAISPFQSVFSGGTHPDVIQGACYALYGISLDLDGARVVVEAGALEYFTELLESQDTEVQKHACRNLGQVASYSSTRRAVIAAKPCARLVALLDGGNVDIFGGALYALIQISRDLDGAKAVLEAGALELLSRLLESYDPRIRRDCCWTLAWLASYSLTRGAVIAAEPCARLVALLGDGHVDVIDGACFALLQIFSSPDGARAVVAVGMLDFIPELLESANTDVRRWAACIVTKLALHPSRRGVVPVQLPTHLVALLE
ncbi:armadillo-type protein [Mycena metata]|uniref:Armadillo-type protein n=1 Tax=Mycena metata TaxID=1033252 RepID=A0AAD7NB70_9AGAR|nr:armadillo-type protein [Mycena metata]